MKYLYSDSDSDLYLFEAIAAIKWGGGFICRKKINGKICKNETAYEGKKKYSKRCKKCGYLETATAYTAFHKLRMPITKAVEILFELQKNYSYFISEDDPDNIARLQLSVLGKKCGVTPKAIGLFLKRIGQWLPKSTDYSDHEWSKGLKSKRSRNYHAAIFELLIDEHKNSSREHLEILYRLTVSNKKKRWDKSGVNIYEDKLQNYLERVTKL